VGQPSAQKGQGCRGPRGAKVSKKVIPRKGGEKKKKKRRATRGEARGENILVGGEHRKNRGGPLGKTERMGGTTASGFWQACEHRDRENGRRSQGRPPGCRPGKGAPKGKKNGIGEQKQQKQVEPKRKNCTY